MGLDDAGRSVVPGLPAGKALDQYDAAERAAGDQTRAAGSAAECYSRSRQAKRTGDKAGRLSTAAETVPRRGD